MSVQKEFIKGTKWTTIQQTVVVILALVRLSVLARMLEKSTFGLFAIVMLLVGFTTIFSDLGITVSLYHKKEISKVQYSTLYWLNIILNITLYVLLIILIPVAIWYFKEPVLREVIPVMGLNLLFISLGKHFQIYAEKEYRFKEIAFIAIIANSLGLILAIYLAFIGHEIFALVYSVLFIGLFSSISYFILMFNKYKLGFVFKFKEVKSFFKIGLYQSGGQIIDFVANQVDILLIGPILGTEALGVYNLIKQFAQKVYGLINAVISKVSIPIFSSFNDDESLLRSRYLQLVGKLSFLNALIYSFFAFMAYEVLYLLYGQGYSHESLIFSIFCIIFYFYSVANLAGILVVSKGKTKYNLTWTIYRVILSTGLVAFLGYKFGLLGAVFGLLIFSLQAVYTYWRFLIVKVQPNITFSDHLLSFAPNVLMGLALYFVSYFTSKLISPSYSFVPVLLIKGGIFGLFSLGYLFLFKKKEINDVMNLFSLKYRI